MTDFTDDDLQAAGDDYRDRTLEDRLNDLQTLGYPDNNQVNYGFPIPYPPRPQDIA